MSKREREREREDWNTYLLPSECTGMSIVLVGGKRKSGRGEREREREREWTEHE